jgi:hypothetical protein
MEGGTHMSEPIIFVSQQRIKPGKLEGYRQFAQNIAAQFEANRPGTVSFLGYTNEAGTEATFIYTFPSAEAMQAHVQYAAEVAKGSSEFIDVLRLEIYGRPTDAILDGMRKLAGSGVTLIVKPQSLGGYLRPAAK